MDATKTLGDEGPIRVTPDAARAYGAIVRQYDERAAAELAELLRDARPVASDPGRYRIRRRSTGLDIQVRVVRGVVVNVNVRPLNAGGRRR